MHQPNTSSSPGSAFSRSGFAPPAGIMPGDNAGADLACWVTALQMLIKSPWRMDETAACSCHADSCLISSNSLKSR